MANEAQRGLKKVFPKKKEEKAQAGGTVHLSRFNYYVLGAALISIAVGFVLLAKGSISAAPVLLVLGYCVLVPVALVLKK